MKNPIHTSEYISKLISYDPVTGILTWLERPNSSFMDNGKRAKGWNTKFSGKTAFTAKVRGYYSGTIEGVKYYAHRVAWCLYYGEWPDGHIDHINGDRCDNRIENLRVVSNQQNAMNRCRNKNTDINMVGISKSKSGLKWRARIRHLGKDHHLGYFDNLSEAISARKAAEVKYGFHPNHGT